MKTLAHPEDTAEILRRIRIVRPESAGRWGRMSAHQMVCHLCDSVRVAIGRKRASPATGPLQRTIVKWVALYVPIRWPPGILTRPEIDQACGGTRPGVFLADVEELERLIEQMAAQPASLEGQVHPVFGAMSVSDWLRWGYLHADHHLRQFGA